MGRRVVRFHLFARRSRGDNGKLFATADGGWESGHWRIAHATARDGVGAEIHLHEARNATSWAAGRITGWRPSETEPGRVVFSLKRDDTLRRAQHEGWGQEKAFVRD